MIKIDDFMARLEEAIGTFSEFLEALMPKEKKKVYDAGFARPSELLSSFNKGFRFGTKALTAKSSLRGALIYGNTGSGKNTCVLVPSILKMMGTCSFIINDPSKELWKLCSNALSKTTTIKIVNFSDPTKGGYNVLKRLKTTSDIRKLCQILIHNSLGVSKDEFWNKAAMDLLAILVRIVLYQPEEQRNMFTVYQLLNRLSFAPESVDRLCVRTQDKTLLSDYKTFMGYDSKMFMSIVATCRSAISIFNDPEVALCTSYDTVGLEDIRTTKTAIFIHSSVPNMKYYSVLISLFFEQAFAEIMAEVPAPDVLPIYLLIDEAATLSQMQSLPISYNNIRKYLGGIMAIYQSPFQLVDIFGTSGAKALEENAFARLYLPGMNITVATELEHTLGKFEFVDDENGTRKVRPLMVASELRESKESFLLCPTYRAIKLNMRPYYQQPRLNRLSKLKPHTPQNKLPFQTPPTIEFEK